MVLLILTVFIALFISFLCSILEATLLSANVASLTELQKKGKRGAGTLLYLKKKRIDDAISSILTLNTIAHTIGAALAGAQAAALWGDRWVGVFSAVLTLLILVVTEIIPKTLGTVYALPLAGIVGPITLVLAKTMLPILFITRTITRMIAKNRDSVITRGEISAMFTLAASQGAITSEQGKALQNLLNDDRLSVADVMTPRSVITMISAKATIAEMLAKDEVNAFSRIPLYGENFDDVKGYILVREIFNYAVKNRQHDRTLGTFLRPIGMIPKSYTIGESLRQLTRKKEHMALVLDEFGGVSGLVTLEDLFETILGVEIIDELDRVVDLRRVALEIRDQRLVRIEKKRGETETRT